MTGQIPASVITSCLLKNLFAVFRFQKLFLEVLSAVQTFGIVWVGASTYLATFWLLDFLVTCAPSCAEHLRAHTQVAERSSR